MFKVGDRVVTNDKYRLTDWSEEGTVVNFDEILIYPVQVQLDGKDTSDAFYINELDPIHKPATLTKGGTQFGPIYERLRKRSYRRMLRSVAAWEDWLDRPYEDLLTPEPEVYWEETHEAYVAGVRDGLKAAL